MVDTSCKAMQGAKKAVEDMSEEKSKGEALGDKIRKGTVIFKALEEMFEDEDVTEIPLEKVKADLKAQGIDPQPLIDRIVYLCKTNRLAAEAQQARN